MRILLVLIGLIAAASAVSVYDIVKEEWLTFKLSHSKKYKSDEEEKFRMKIFMENKHKVAKHNQKYAKRLVSYKLGINKYADLLHHEFTNIMNGFNRSNSQALNEIRKERGVTFISPANVKLPKLVDWRETGAVTPVKDQGHCGSCWSFSATGALEGQHFRKTGVLIALSEQNLVDCSSSYGNNGCNGGLMDQAFSYIKDNGGIDTEISYPYEGIDDSCHFDKAKIGATDKGFIDIPEGDELKLKEAIATIGPVSVAIDASHESFQFYKEGVYDEPTCDSAQLDHGVLAVGYGTEEDGTDYWLVKNSWGITWGDKGYIKMTRNKDNQCGIATSASFPQV